MGECTNECSQRNVNDLFSSFFSLLFKSSTKANCEYLKCEIHMKKNVAIKFIS